MVVEAEATEVFWENGPCVPSLFWSSVTCHSVEMDFVNDNHAMIIRGDVMYAKKTSAKLRNSEVCTDIDTWKRGDLLQGPGWGI